MNYGFSFSTSLRSLPCGGGVGTAVFERSVDWFWRSVIHSPLSVRADGADPNPGIVVQSAASIDIQALPATQGVAHDLLNALGVELLEPLVIERDRDGVKRPLDLDIGWHVIAVTHGPPYATRRGYHADTGGKVVAATCPTAVVWSHPSFGNSQATRSRSDGPRSRSAPSS